MKIKFLLYKNNDDPNYEESLQSYKVAQTWEEIKEFERKGFAGFTRRAYLITKALELNKSLENEILKIRKKFGLPENGLPTIEGIKLLETERISPGYSEDVFKKFTRFYSFEFYQCLEKYVIQNEVYNQLMYLVAYNLVLNDNFKEDISVDYDSTCEDENGVPIIDRVMISIPRKTRICVCSKEWA